MHTPYPLPPARPPRRSTRGATVLVVVGAVVLAVALAAGVVGATLFWRALPTGVVDGAGAPGSAALASGPVPGAAELGVEAGEPYTVWAVVGRGGEAFDHEDVRVECAGAEAGVRAPTVSGSSGSGARSATAVAEVVAPLDGDCTVEVVSGSSTAESFVVTTGWRFGEFFATVGGTVLLWLVAIGGGLVGLGLLVGGVVWRIVARRA